MAFFDRNYHVPTNSRYMKFVGGENRFRVIGDIVTGYEEWRDGTEGREVTRVPEDEADSLGTDKRYFIAMPVFNHNEGGVQILLLTQNSLITRLRNLGLNPRWGSPRDYDIVVTKEGDGIHTRYSMTPEPKSPLDNDLEEAVKKVTVDLSRLYEGKDPFEAG